MPFSQCNDTLLTLNKGKNLAAYRDGLQETQYCAWDPTGHSDSCQGDSGGPLQLITDAEPVKIVGVVSFGTACGTNQPGIYTRVGKYVDWIGSHVWPNGEIEPPLIADINN